MDNGLIKGIENLPVEDTSAVKEQLRLFLLNKATRDTKRIEMLTDALDTLQEKYIERAMSYMKDHDDDSAILYLPEMIRNISQYIKDSGETIGSVLENREAFDSLCVINNPTINNNSTTNVIDSLNIDGVSTSVDSRRKIRNTITEILKLASEEDVIVPDESTVE